MLGYEPPAPKLWKALVGAGIVVFPLFYLADVTLLHHRPGWIYALVCGAATLIIGYQMYSNGPENLKRIRFGAPLSGFYGNQSWRPPERRETKDSD